MGAGLHGEGDSSEWLLSGVEMTGAVRRHGGRMGFSATGTAAYYPIHAFHVTSTLRQSLRSSLPLIRSRRKMQSACTVHSIVHL